MLDTTNSLKTPYKRYTTNQVVRLCKEIPPERRKQLVEEIKARAVILGYQNGNALKAALRHLGKEV